MREGLFVNLWQKKPGKCSNIAVGSMTPWTRKLIYQSFRKLVPRCRIISRADLGGGYSPPPPPPTLLPEMIWSFLIQLVLCKKNVLLALVTQFLTGAPPPQKNPVSSPVSRHLNLGEQAHRNSTGFVCAYAHAFKAGVNMNRSEIKSNY